MAPPKPSGKANTSPAPDASAARPSSAQSGQDTQDHPGDDRKSPPPAPPPGPTPNPNWSFTANLNHLKTTTSHAASVLRALNVFLAAKGVDLTLKHPKELFPDDWRVGSTVIRVEHGSTVSRGLGPILPNLRIFGRDGKEMHWITDTTDPSLIDRVKADWDSPVVIIAGILTAITGKNVSKEEVLKLAQTSPQALEKLKEAGSSLKSHLNRLLDPVSLSRSPEFLEVSARYRAQLRVLIDDQQAKIREAKIATRRVNQLLGERDEALSKLDAKYTPKRATAAAALAQYGISLEEEQSALAEDDVVRGLDLEDLNF
nr:hypothetical protein [Penicillium citrinum non-segmented dsRNA virus 1]